MCDEEKRDICIHMNIWVIVAKCGCRCQFGDSILESPRFAEVSDSNRPTDQMSNDRGQGLPASRRHSVCHAALKVSYRW